MKEWYIKYHSNQIPSNQNIQMKYVISYVYIIIQIKIVIMTSTSIILIWLYPFLIRMNSIFKPIILKERSILFLIQIRQLLYAKPSRQYGGEITQFFQPSFYNHLKGFIVTEPAIPGVVLWFECWKVYTPLEVMKVKPFRGTIWKNFIRRWVLERTLVDEDVVRTCIFAVILRGEPMILINEDTSYVNLL